MKQLTTLVLLLFTLVSFSQKKFEGKATYMSKRTIDMSRFDKMSAISILKETGKIIDFGVSNFIPSQFNLIDNTTSISS